MLSPEVWNFKPPQHYFSVEKRNHNIIKVPDIVDSHYFNHSVSLVLPDTVRNPDKLQTCVSEDSDYYRINEVNVHDLVNKEFIEAFVKKGELSLLTIGNKIDVDNSIAITPTGHLILSLLTEDFQTLGLEGKASFFDRKVHTRYGKFQGDK
ncbi:Ribonuclease P protein subunit p40 [Dufourea novaeangliae]|uniref:Ribonuclease P protein subunit p40 n=1 Tax=Dufourea novaeangliae TaxID=178035 RepID=A0A154NZH1_DUFNO|nr:Ribonuclease P protein subunit p40 [Dufourea novaeangliae]